MKEVGSGGTTVNSCSDAGAEARRESGQLLTVNDVARLCGVSPRTVRNWVATKGLPSVKIDRTRRFRPESVFVWIEQRERSEGPLVSGQTVPDGGVRA